MTASQVIRTGLNARDYEGLVTLVCVDGARFTGTMVGCTPDYVTITQPTGDLAFALGSLADVVIP